MFINIFIIHSGYISYIFFLIIYIIFTHFLILCTVKLTSFCHYFNLGSIIYYLDTNILFVLLYFFFISSNSIKKIINIHPVLYFGCEMNIFMAIYRYIIYIFFPICLLFFFFFFRGNTHENGKSRTKTYCF